MTAPMDDITDIGGERAHLSSLADQLMEAATTTPSFSSLMVEAANALDRVASRSPAVGAEGIAEGWRVVPVVPTPEMLAACAPATQAASAEDYALAEKAIDLLPPVQHPEATDIVAELARDYRAMISAAPSPPSSAGERDPEFADQIMKAEARIARNRGGDINVSGMAVDLFGVFDRALIGKLLRYARMWSLAIPALDDGAGNGGVA